ncbi:hypothetical protein R5R35_004501 [Gryllus longicercus]|uniref:Pacifastin domain-containing protein n=1 Tax=Gryllus longicercus TaxID=2509291 RepID=A0AAN9Z485_9ORTH
MTMSAVLVLLMAVALTAAHHVPGHLTDDAHAPPVPENKCVPGTTWKLDCNTCHCTDSGISICTALGCLDNIPKLT